MDILHVQQAGHLLHLCDLFQLQGDFAELLEGDRVEDVAGIDHADEDVGVGLEGVLVRDENLDLGIVVSQDDLDPRVHGDFGDL